MFIFVKMDLSSSDYCAIIIKISDFWESPSRPSCIYSYPREYEGSRAFIHTLENMKCLCIYSYLREYETRGHTFIHTLENMS